MPKSLIEQAIRVVFCTHWLPERVIAGIATIDTKRNEAGLIEFCVDRNLPLFFYPAEVLRSVTVLHPSSTINAVVGTPSVAEAAALLACREAGRACQEAGMREEGQITAETQRDGECTPTLLSMPILHLPKQCYRGAEQWGAVTIAVARLA